MMLDRENLLLALKITEDAAANGMHRQEKWLVETVCGTAGCFAGNWALHRGCSPDYQNNCWPTKGTAVVIFPEGTKMVVSDFVRQDLGLTLDEASELFYEGNSLDDLRRIVHRIVGEG